MSASLSLRIRNNTLTYILVLLFSGHKYPEVRRPNAQQQEQVQNLLDVHVPATSIQRVISQKHGLTMLSQDIHNLRDKNRKQVQAGRTDGEMLCDSLQAIVQNDPGCTVSVVEDNGDISVIFLQTTPMKRMLNVYGSMLFVDGTYCVNRYAMPLYVFSVVDGNRQGQVVAYGILKDERAATLLSLFLEFERHSNLSQKVKVVMVDKDLNEISKIMEVYPHVSIMLCRFHVLKAFRSGTADHCDKENRDQIRGLLETMVYSPSEEEYNDAMIEIANISSEFCDYFERSWSTCKQSWAGFCLKDVPHSGHYTNNVIESHNQKIKAVIKRNCTLPELVDRLLDLQASKGIADQQKVSSMILKTPSVSSGVSALTRSAMQQISEVATNVVTSKLMQQLEKVETLDYSVESGDGDNIVVKHGERQYHVSDGLMSCSCTFFIKYSLPCSHIFFARREQGQPIFEEEMIPPNARKSVLIAAIHSGDDVTTHTHGVFVTRRPPAQSPAVRESSKFQMAMEELKILASSMIKCSSARFEARLQQVRQLHSLWWSDKDVLITEGFAPSTALLDSPPANLSSVEHVPSASVQLVPSSPAQPDGPPIPLVSNAGISLPPNIVAPSSSTSAMPSSSAWDTPLVLDEDAYPLISSPIVVPIPSSNAAGISLTQAQDISPPPTVAGTSHSSSSPIEDMPSSNANDLSSLKVLNIPPPLKVRGRPKGIHLTVVGKRKRVNHQGPNKRKKANSLVESFLCMVADKDLVSQVLIQKKKLDEEHIECMPDNVQNEIVNCVKKDLRPYFTADGWLCFLNLIKSKEVKLYTCPVCHKLDDHTLKMICCDRPGCEQWYHFQCIGMSSHNDPDNLQWFCDQCRLL